ncbi:MAG: prepilin peptidase, partial [Clostridia bacterium]|nr:prepilin peptidase [Clostridia bacterium]
VVAWAAVFGLVVGSFANVVITRLPRGLSLVRPASHCPRCGRMLPPWELVPLASFLVLRGRCRGCRQPIGWRYPLVELTVATLFATSAWRKGLGPELYPALLVSFLAPVVAAIDWEWRLILNRLLAAGLAASLPYVGWRVVVAGEVWRPLAGAGTVGGALLAIAWLSRGGMGLGDVKWGALLGLLLGPERGLVLLAVAFLAGGMAAAGLLLSGRAGRRAAVAFGPYLSLGGVVALLWGDSLLTWYLGMR